MKELSAFKLTILSYLKTFFDMKKYIVYFIIVIICTSVTNIFFSFLIYNFLNPESDIFSIKSLAICAIFPIILFLFEREIKIKKLILISISYSFLYTLISNYM